MINKVHVPCKGIDSEDIWRRIKMGGSTGRGKGHGTIIGDVNHEGRLKRWYSKTRERFPGSGTLNGGCCEEGSGIGYG